MEKTVPAFAARRQFGKLLQDVTAKGDTYVVERHGEAIAAVVPIEVYEGWKRGREEFFHRLRQRATRADLSDEEALDLVDEAIRAVRGGTNV